MALEQFLSTLAAVALYDIAKARYASYIMQKRIKELSGNTEILKKIIGTMNGGGGNDKTGIYAGIEAKASSNADRKRRKEGKNA